MSLAGHIMRFRPIRYGWAGSARWYIAINRIMLISPRAHAPPAPLARIEKSAYARWQLALLYGFAGFG